MKANTNYFLLGLFVIAGGLLTVAGVIVLASARLGRESIAVETYFTESVIGLDVGSPVRFRGVKIGEVRHIGRVDEKYETEHRYVLVEVAVTAPRYTDRPLEQVKAEQAKAITEGMRVRLASQGLTGIAYIETDYLDAETFPPLPIDWEPAVPYVPSATSEIGHLANNLDQVLTNLRRTDVPGLVDSAKQAIDGFKAAVDGVDVAGLSKQAQATMQSIRDLAAETGKDVKALVADGRKALSRAENALGKIDEALADDPLGNALRNFEEVSEQARTAVTDLRDVIEDTGGLVRDGRQLLKRPQRDLDTILANLRQATDSLNSLTTTLEKYPSLLLFGEKPKPTLLRK